jgi:hypothetical protein
MLEARVEACSASQAPAQVNKSSAGLNERWVFLFSLPISVAQVRTLFAFAYGLDWICRFYDGGIARYKTRSRMPYKTPERGAPV